jgi:hypothetical protein
MFCAPRLIWSGTECVRSRFHVLRFQTHFRQYRGCRVPFSCFTPLTSFWAVPRAHCPVFMFYALDLVWGCIEGVRSRFHVFCSRTCFGRYRGSLTLFSYFALSDSFWALLLGPVFMFYAPDLVLGGTEGALSRFHVLRSSSGLGLYRGRRVPFSCFLLPNSFWALSREPGPIFIFCALRLILGVTVGAGSHFHVSYFTLPELFSAVPRVSDPDFMFCALGLVLGGTEGA